MAGLVQLFNAPPFVSPVPVRFETKNAITGSFEPLHAGTVQVVLVQDSPESRQFMLDTAPYGVQAPEGGHYDYIMLHDAFAPGVRTPPVQPIKRNDRIIPASGEILTVTFEYTVPNYCQLVWAVKVNASRARPPRVT
jgi:hypothetical protein